MAKICSECGTSNPDINRVCRSCGQPLALQHPSATRQAQGDMSRGSAQWVAALIIALLILCCLCLIGVALLDELMPSHPFQTMIVGTPTPTATSTQPPTPTATPTYTPTPLRRTPGPGADSFEPDDSLAEASPIETDGTSQAHTLRPAGDRDYVSFQVEAGTRYIVETGGLSPECDTVLTLYDEDGTELDRDDDGGQESLASLVSWTAREDGILFAEVSQFDELAEGDDNRYELWVTEAEPVVTIADEYEPDDMMEHANEILLEAPQVHGIHDPEDEDWVFFAVEVGKTYLIETSDLEGGMDTIIFLYDEEGEKLAENDDSDPDSQASRIVWMAKSSGILYVAIQDYYGEEATPEMGYTISVSEGAPYEADAYEPDDSQEQAGVIEVGSFQTHNLHVTSDHDWLCYQAVSGKEYVLETLNLGDRIDTFIALYGPEGELLTEDDDGGGEPLASRCTWTAGEDGTLCFMVRDLGDGQAGPGTEYTVALQEEGTSLLAPDSYEPDDTLATARRIDLAEPQSHNIHSAGDHDWLFFETESGVTYIMETYNLGDEIDSVLFLYDADGQELAQDDDGADDPRASRITWTAEQAGTVYIMVRDYKDDRATRAMRYDVSVRESDGAQARSEASIYIADGAYHITTAEMSRFVVGVSEVLSLEDFSLEVDAAQVSGSDDNEYGLVCGYEDDDNYYELAISGDGYVGFFAKEQGRWDTIVPFSGGEAINQGNSVNHLRLEVDQGFFSFYVNGQLTLQEYDRRLGEGLIGFGCGCFAEPDLHCSFDNLTVWDAEGELVWEDDFKDNSGEWFQSVMP
jgi:hypothetical protein